MSHYRSDIQEDCLFIERFDAHLEEYGHAPAIYEGGDLVMTYADLACRSHELCNELLRVGNGYFRVGQENSENRDFPVVALLMEKSAAYIASLLAVWRAGAAFMPIDPTLPPERLAMMVQESGARFAFASEQHEKLASSLGLQVVKSSLTRALAPDFLAESDMSIASSFRARNEHNLAYLIYTSGSTGRAKGVLVKHDGLVSMLDEQIAMFGLNRHSRSLFFLSTNFDASISDIGTNLLAGAALYIEPRELLDPGGAFFETLEKRGITHIDIPPAFLSILDAEAAPDCLETLIVGGESCSLGTVRSWAQRVRLVNVYGPTEATVCTSMSVCGADWLESGIGEPLSGVEYRVVDEKLETASPGEPGELLISGRCLALGYLRRPDLDQLKFVYLPLDGAEKNEAIRWYRTGDLVRSRKNGDLEFLGRLDRQFKLRGMLIAPEEIESVLSRCAEIAGAAVLKHKNHKGMEYLVAIIETKSSLNSDCLYLSDLPEDLELRCRASIQESLPVWMCPARFLRCSSLPRLVSGKIDFRELSRCLDLYWSAQNNSALDELPVANELLSLIEEVLERKSLDLRKSFFEMGGDSYSAIVLSLRARQKRIALAPAQIYACPTLEDLLALNLVSDTNSEDVLSAEFLDEHAQLAEKTEKNLQVIYSSNESSKKPLSKNMQKESQSLLTGATGFLGSRLLLALLRGSDARVHCLVRAENEKIALQRLQQKLLPLLDHRKESWEAMAKRIVAIPADLEQERLGLSCERWRELVLAIDSIYHCAARVNMLLPFGELRAANLEGSRTIVDFIEESRLAGRSVELHYASTLSVFVSSDRNRGIAMESDDLSRTGVVYGGYAQSKWASERLIARLAALVPCVRIYRLGLLVGDSTTGLSDEGDFFAMFVKGLCSLKFAPRPEELVSVDITPVDFAVELMYRLSSLSGSSGVFHIANSRSLSLWELLQFISSYGIELEFVSASEFFERLERIGLSNLTREEHLACAALFRVLKDDTSSENMCGFKTMDLFQATDIAFDMTNCRRALGEDFIQCPLPEEKLIHRLIHGALQGSGDSR